MSCSSCHHSPCSCDDVCDPNNEPLASALNNFISSFFGSVSKTCVDNQVQWILPCDLNTGLTGFERRQGEGVACYLLRLFEYLNSIVSGGGSSNCAPWYNKVMVGGVCYDTWQAAYDANSGAASPTLMLVGQGSTFGNLNLTAAYNPNIVVMGVGRAVSTLGDITGNGNAVPISAFNIQMGSITSSGAAITINGLNVAFGAIASTNAAGAGGDISVGSTVETGALTANGTTTGGAITVSTLASVGAISATGTSGSGGAVILGREVVGASIVATGANGGSVTLGDECTVTAITSKPLVAPNAGGTITISDDCVFTALDNSGTVAGTLGGIIILGDRCEGTTLNSSGVAGGGPITIGEGFTGTSIDSRSTASGNGGAIIASHRLTLSAGITCSGAANGGAVTIGQSANIGLSIVGTGLGGNSGPIALGDGSHYDNLSVAASANVGNISIGKFCVVGAITCSTTGGTRGTFTILEGTTVNGAITGTSTGNGGSITIGNSVTITGNCNFDANSGDTSAATIGMGCNLQNFRNGSNTGSAGGITIGQATTALQIYSGTAGGVGDSAGAVVIGEGCRVIDVYAHSTNPGSNSASVTLQPGASASFIDVSSNTGTGGNVILKNSNILNSGFGTLCIQMGTSTIGTITAINARINDQIDNVNGSSIFRDCVFSTPAANRNCIANLTASNSQYTNCLFVPNGTGVSIQASAPRTIIAYFLLQKNPFPANVTLSEGTETTSPNLLAP